MKFLCLGYFNREAMEAVPQAEVDTLMDQCRPHMDVLYKTGQVLVDAGLHLEAKCVRRVKGKLKVTDGPYIETKEMIGGVFMIEAQDMEEAIRVASLHPTTAMVSGERYGWALEIRPLHYYRGEEEST